MLRQSFIVFSAALVVVAITGKFEFFTWDKKFSAFLSDSNLDFVIM